MLPYVMVEDIDRTLEQACELGGETVTPRMALGPGDAFAILRDPAGNLLGIYQGR
jgi:predicted enzyme related to lactoylglutathione lyase